MRTVSTDGISTLGVDSTYVTNATVSLGAAAPPVVGSNDVLFCAAGSTISAFGGDGRRLWQRAVGGTPVGAAAGDRGKLAVATASGLVAAFGKNGDPWWSVSTGHAIRMPPTITFFENVIVATDDGYLLSLDGRTGKPTWSTRLGGPAGARAVPTPWATVFVATRTDLEAFSAEGKPLWRVPRPGGVSEPALGRGERLYAVDGSGNLFRTDPGGKVVWSIPVGAGPAAPPIVDLGDVVYAATADGKVHAVADLGDSAEGRWTADLGSSAVGRLVLAPGGVLYAVLRDGSVAAIGRPLTGYRAICESWSAGTPVCPAACVGCAAEFDRCASDPGCERIARCVLSSGCRSATSCSLPTACGPTVQSSSGLSGESLRRAVALGTCAGTACGGGVR